MSSGLKLLPCPFCGGEAVVEPEGVRYFAAFCERCDIVGPFGDGSEDAAKRWNTRTRAPSDAALVEALDACKVKFAEYALLHYRKRTPDGDEKAMANQRMADMCDAALAAAKGQQPALDRNTVNGGLTDD